MTETNSAFMCPNCEIEIVGRPTFHVGLAFCCAGCVVGGPCTCSYEYEHPETVRVHECLDLTAATYVPRPRPRDVPRPRPEPVLAGR